ncbi:MAG: hypothetical protein JO300_06790, partial [Silvibacterium sp.]|nr:hypothetical protein [Silvibacterium sp.]
MPPRLLRQVSSFFCLLLLAPALTAQKYDIQKISFTGYPAATQAELMTVAGLQSGVPLGQPEIQAAAHKISETGLFSNVQFAFDGAELKFTLQPADGAVPALFANFPWWDNKALTAAVAAKVPLFHGTVIPESGIQQQVTAALAALVAERGVQATITSQPHSDLGKLVGLEFRIESPPIQIAEVRFAGASAGLAEPVN